MNFWKTMGVVLRRWYVSAPIAVLSLAVGAAVFVAVPPQYESTGTIVLTAPISGGVSTINPKDATGPSNPLLDFPGSLTITAQLLIQSLSSPGVRQQITHDGGSGTFQAGDGQTGGPFVVIIADATSRARAQQTVSLALRHASHELDQRQQELGAPTSTFIVTQIVVAPTPATTKISNKVEGGGIALVAGLMISLIAAYCWARVWTNRRRTADHNDDTDRETNRDGHADNEMLDDPPDIDHDAPSAITNEMRPDTARHSHARRDGARREGARPAPHPAVGSMAAHREPDQQQSL